MNEISKGEGRTVLFVSHNMAAVKSLCNQGIVLEHGKVLFSSDADTAVDYYLSNASKVKDTSLVDRRDRLGNSRLLITGIDFLNEKNEMVSQVISGDMLKVRLNLKKNDAVDYSKLFVGLSFHDNQENKVVSFLSDEMGSNFSHLADKNYIELNIPNLYLRAGIYDITFQLSGGSTKAADFIDMVEKAAEIIVLPGDIWNSGKTSRPGNYAVFPAHFV